MDMGPALKAYSDVGTLSIGRDAVEFSSGNKQLRIPYSSIVDEVRWEGVGSDVANSWAVVRFRVAGSDELAAFKDGNWLGWGGESRRIYLTLKRAHVAFSGPEAE